MILALGDSDIGRGTYIDRLQPAFRNALYTTTLEDRRNTIKLLPRTRNSHDGAPILRIKKKPTSRGRRHDSRLQEIPELLMALLVGEVTEPPSEQGVIVEARDQHVAEAAVVFRI